MKNKGIVVKIKDSYCIILTGEGTYHKIPRSWVTSPRVGAETEFFPVNRVNRFKPLLMVACLLVVLLGMNVYRMAALADPAAYVSLDINPSVELGVDKNTKVITVLALNQDAENLLDGMDLKGKNLYLAVREILNGAAVSGYIKPDETNYILSTVTSNESSPDIINYDSMAQNLQKSLENKDLDVNLVILTADSNTRKEAKNKGISTGKLLVYKSSIDSGEKITLEQVRQNSVSKLVKSYNTRLLAGKKNGFVKLIHVPRKNGHLKKESAAPNNDESPVNPNLTVPAKETKGKDNRDGKGILKSKSEKADQPIQKDILKPKNKSDVDLNKIRETKKLKDNRQPDREDKKNIMTGDIGKQGGKNKQSRPAGPVNKYNNKSTPADNNKNPEDRQLQKNTYRFENHQRSENKTSTSEKNQKTEKSRNTAKKEQ